MKPALKCTKKQQHFRLPYKTSGKVLYDTFSWKHITLLHLTTVKMISGKYKQGFISILVSGRAEVYLKTDQNNL